MHELKNDRYRAVIAPEAGGAVMSLSRDGRTILRPAPSVDAVKTDPRKAACFPCVPWFGRLFGGLDFDSRRYDLKPTLPTCDAEHALPALRRERRGRQAVVAAADDDQIELHPVYN